MNSASTVAALHIFPFASPGWNCFPLIVTTARHALKFSHSKSPTSPPSIVYAKSPTVERSSFSVPRPTSSSGVKTMRSVGCGDGRPLRWDVGGWTEVVAMGMVSCCVRTCGICTVFHKRKVFFKKKRYLKCHDKKR